MAWVQKGEFGRAVNDFTTAITLDPNYASAFLGRGLAKQKMGDVTGAEADFEAAKAINQRGAEGFVKRDRR
jgi:Flp pilus assembly protein TadD